MQPKSQAGAGLQAEQGREITPMPGRAGAAGASGREVRKPFPGGHEARRGVSLEVRRGEVLAILGTSGSGKTTLLKLVNRLIEPSSGEVLVHGIPTGQWDPIELRRA